MITISSTASGRLSSGSARSVASSRARASAWRPSRCSSALQIAFSRTRMPCASAREPLECFEHRGVRVGPLAGGHVRLGHRAQQFGALGRRRADQPQRGAVEPGGGCAGARPRPPRPPRAAPRSRRRRRGGRSARRGARARPPTRRAPRAPARCARARRSASRPGALVDGAAHERMAEAEAARDVGGRGRGRSRSSASSASIARASSSPAAAAASSGSNGSPATAAPSSVLRASPESSASSDASAAATARGTSTPPSSTAGPPLLWRGARASCWR